MEHPAIAAWREALGEAKVDTTSGTLARFAEGGMPKKAMDKPLVVEIRKILDALVLHHLEREPRSARFVRDALTR